jgi:hypothetical protein
VVLLNIAYFGIEFAVAVAIGSVSLFADSIDFMEDSSINFLIIVALGWTARNRARVGLAEVQHSGASGTGCPNTHRAGGARSQLVLRIDAHPPPPPQRQPHAGGVPVGAQ